MEIEDLFPALDHWPKEEDFYAIGGQLNQSSLVEAYRKGIFPWPDPKFPDVIWASPASRGVLFTHALHVSKSLRRHLKREAFEYSFNRDFAGVIENCAAAPRAGQEGTWITDEMKRAYTDLFRAGQAFSVEVWKEKKLVGGLYGVAIDKNFSAESMFHLCDNASKAALVHLVTELQKMGVGLLDIQVLTPVTEAMGATLIPRELFLSLLKTARNPGWTLPWM